MKTTGILTIAAVAILLIAFVTSGCKQDIIDKSNQMDADLKMYATAWDDLMHKSEIDQMEANHFTKDITFIGDPENVVGLAIFEVYYKNHLTGFSDINITFENVFGQGDNISIGKMVDVERVTLVKLRDSEVAQKQDSMDNSVFMQPSGLTSNPDRVAIMDSAYQVFNVDDMTDAALK
ncbi:hypothetical protein G3O08_01425 [Cryomorpha ignava]|uniref:Nuclear transport factor 2 family protein n=1 Tax=Cryomorpha ignava TaxID=101383 RepID=A0A7K3WMQ6_9FLAO|nr:hypothetical protein [Cryomorpha ignava]NEN22162.1 hypothetical protein [Cryomorpha ignava]